MSRFNLTYEGGIRSGKDPGEVRRRFGRFLAIDDPQRLERFFSGTRVILRRNLERRDAAIWYRKFTDIGMEVELVAVEAAAEPAAPAQAVDDSALRQAEQRAAERAARELSDAIATRLPEQLPSAGDGEGDDGDGDNPNLFTMRPFRSTAGIHARAAHCRRASRVAAAVAAALCLLAGAGLWLRSQLPPAQAPALRAAAVTAGGELLLLAGDRLIRHDRAGAAEGVTALETLGLVRAEPPLLALPDDSLLLAGVPASDPEGPLRLLRCSETCTSFGPGLADAKALALAQSRRSGDVYVGLYFSEGTGGEIRQLSPGGELRARAGWELPPRPVLQHREGLLYAGSAAAPAISVLRPEAAALGEQLDEILLLPPAALAREHSRVLDLVATDGHWWVTLATADGSDAAVYRFDRQWNAIGEVAVLPRGRPGPLLAWRDRLLVLPQAGAELQRFSAAGLREAPLVSGPLEESIERSDRLRRWQAAGWNAAVTILLLAGLAAGAFARYQYLLSLVSRQGRARGAEPVDDRAAEVAWIKPAGGRPVAVRRAASACALLAAAALTAGIVLGATPAQLASMLIALAGPAAALVLLWRSPAGRIGILGDELLLVDHTRMYHHGNGPRLQYRRRFVIVDDVVVFCGNRLLPALDPADVDERVMPIARTGIKVDRATVWVKLCQNRHPFALAAAALAASLALAALVLLF